jgi:glycosyltransferase involved in cell wall biosynthesis
MDLRVLVYTDSPVYGGHEVTLCEAIEGFLHQGIDVIAVISRQNSRLLARLEGVLSREGLIVTSNFTEKGDVFRAIMRSKKVRDLAVIFRAIEPDIILVSQGAIGLSACGLAAAKVAGVKLVSFLPMAHRVTFIRGKTTAGTLLQDFCYKFLYAMPDGFLTICSTTASILQVQHHVNKNKIGVAYYGLDCAQLPNIVYRFKKQRKASDRPRVGLVGRVEFVQKQHNWFFHTIAKSSFAKEIDYYVIGDGPDLAACRELTDFLGLHDRVHYVGWVENVTEWYQRLDLLALPSRFEGLPVVLIEALFHGIPILASRVDGMGELLPDQWLFEANDCNGMLCRLQELLVGDQSYYVREMQEFAFKSLRKENYQQGMSQSLLALFNEWRSCPKAE